MNKCLLAGVVAALVGTAYAHDHDGDDGFRDHGRRDFGQKVESLARAQSLNLFGVIAPLNASSSKNLTAAQIEANPAGVITVAPGLSVRVVSAAANLGANADQIVLYPNSAHPTHLIVCNEAGTTSSRAASRAAIRCGSRPGAQSWSVRRRAAAGDCSRS
jgi:hypothetical protein